MNAVGSNYYENKFEQGLHQGLSQHKAADLVIHAYLDNKPANPKLSPENKHEMFWKSHWLELVPDDYFQDELFSLALARYFAQEATENKILLTRIASVSPEVIVRSVRYSGIILDKQSIHWQELQAINEEQNECFAELLELRQIFLEAHRDRKKLVDEKWQPLSKLEPIEILCYSSLFAFDQLMQGDLEIGGDRVGQQTLWKSIGRILQRSLQTSKLISLRPTEKAIGKTLKKHLSPILFPSRTGHAPRAFERYKAFFELFYAQLELDRFLSESVDAFCFDDTSKFSVVDGSAILDVIDPTAKEKWLEGNNKLLTLHGYWFNRGWQAFEASEMSKQIIGRPENHESNAMCVIKALSGTLELQEIYGISDAITTDNGLKVDTYQALLASHLMSAFFKEDYVEPFHESLDQGMEWNEALTMLAFNGLVEGMQNRLPFTWSNEEDKARNILGWTVSKEHPKGSIQAAKAILDFWTADLGKLAKEAKDNPGTRIPELNERPFLRMGEYAFQVPWIMAFQNNTTAAINNLRRVGSHRDEARSETGQIEENLAQAFKKASFRVMTGYQPAPSLTTNPGEIDLICYKDSHLLVIEVKSTYLRSSAKSIWQYKTRTLRKAGEQAQRKADAVQALLVQQPDDFQTLNIGVTSKLQFHRWIVDTTIECDHELFSGALKISMQEILIALKDEAHLLVGSPIPGYEGPSIPQTLYPSGFDVKSFINMIENDFIWRQTREAQQLPNARIFNFGTE